MVEQKGKDIIRSIYLKWVVSSILLNILCAVVFTLILISAASQLTSLAWWWFMPLFIVVFVGSMLVNRSWKIPEHEITRSLNVRYPELEESSNLLLLTGDELTILQEIQQQKIEKRLASIKDPRFYNTNIRKAFWVVITGGLLTLVILKLPLILTSAPKQQYNNSNAIAGDSILTRAGIANIEIIIDPPAYTRRSTREQDHFDIKTEAGSEVTWTVHTNRPVEHLSIIFNDKDSVLLEAMNKDRNVWTNKKLITSPGFYQVRIEQHHSELYKIEVIKDLPPSINILSPKQHTVIDYGQPTRFLLKTSIIDDYGLREVSISATVARGKGEGVKFTDQQMTFPAFEAGRKNLQLDKSIDLKALGMQPGDELYYYVSGRDNFNQLSRTDIFIISLPDTAELLSMDGMATGVNLIPEYFRSQRQIIIDTEQLLREKDTISAESFNSRSNSLGIDQKLLRLRYGKFLGEESEDEIGADHDHEEEGNSDNKTFGDASELMKEYGHTHDNAEDATFFEPELKAQLKATLNEMWKSELQLRTYKPATALPFEYKALRLLKDLQQKSRVYVAKTGFNPTPLKPENRLSGELDKIGQPSTQSYIDKKENPEDDVREALSILGMLKTGKQVSNHHIEMLKSSNEQLSLKTSSQPAAYLDGIKALRRVINNLHSQKKISVNDIDLTINAFQKMLSSPEVLPQPNSTTRGGLSQQYFRNLKKSKQ